MYYNSNSNILFNKFKRRMENQSEFTFHIQFIMYFNRVYSRFPNLQNYFVTKLKFSIRISFSNIYFALNINK